MIRFIVPAYNAENTIDKCLTSILAQECEKEVIVVDNGSFDQTKEIVKRYPVKYIYESIKGPSAARNRGLKEAGTFDFLAFVDSDAVLPEEWTQKALERLANYPGIAGVGGPGKSIIKNSVSEAFDFLLYSNTSDEKERNVISLATMDVLYKPECIKGLLFNESLLCAEDPDFNFRLINRGYKLVYSEDLWVFHFNPVKIKQVIRKWFNYGKYYPLPYFLNHRMTNLGLWTRILYIPLVIITCILSFYLKNPIPIIIVVFLFPVVYLALGIKAGIRNILKLFMFVLVHSMKQFAQMLGIWWGFVYLLISRKKRIFTSS